METHANHLHKAPGKNFGHYFFEFLMLFIAVFCGFLAENYREHVVEREKEKQYMHAMIVDLKSDTARIALLISEDSINQPRIDSLMHLLRRPDRNNYGQTMYYFARVITALGGGRFELADRSYEQMKSSGSLRLINDAGVADSVSAYYSKQEDLKQQEQIQLTRMAYYCNAVTTIFDGVILQEMLQKHPYEFHVPKGNPALLTNDETTINEFIGQLHYYSAILTINYNFASEKRANAERLIQLLQSKYHFE